jgi:hypothetical protein
MNVLLDVMKQSLLTLDLGLRGDLTISDAMENLMSALFFETIPPMWEKKSYPTLRSLGPWVTDVIARCTQLADWTGACAERERAGPPLQQPGLGAADTTRWPTRERERERGQPAGG